MSFEAAALLAEGEQLVVVNGPRREVHRVQERCGMPLGEDEPVVAGTVRPAEVVAQVPGEQYGGEIRRGHR